MVATIEGFHCIIQSTTVLCDCVILMVDNECAIYDSAVETGFVTDKIIVTEGALTVVCLETAVTPTVDTLLQVSVMYGTAGPSGERQLLEQLSVVTFQIAFTAL